MSEISVTFKSEKIYRSFTKVPHHPILQDLTLWFERAFGEPFYPLRGLDLRSFIYKNPQNIVDTINKVWMYDYKRPHMKCAIYHDTGQGDHIHLQVHPNTRKI